MKKTTVVPDEYIELLDIMAEIIACDITKNIANKSKGDSNV